MFLMSCYTAHCLRCLFSVKYEAKKTAINLEQDYGCLYLRHENRILAFKIPDLADAAHL
jgi:hypothetical protein